LWLSYNQLTDIKGLVKTLRQKGFIELRIENNPVFYQTSLILESGFDDNHKDDILKYFSDMD